MDGDIRVNSTSHFSNLTGLRRDSLETDMSDSLYEFPVSRQRTIYSKPSIATLDITDNVSDRFLSMEHSDLIKFRKWIVGFCIVNFDLEIGQGRGKTALLFLSFIINASPFFFFLALDYAYPPMDLSPSEQQNM
jgi:hypothetical protein